MNINTCPNCKGNKSVKIDDTHFKCDYCGSIFEIDNHKTETKETEPTDSQSTTQAPQVIYVQAPQPQQQQSPQIIIEKKSGNGCLGALAIGIIVFGIILCFIGGADFGMPFVVLGIILGVASRPFNKTNPS